MISKFIEIGNEATGNNVSYQEITDEQNYAIFDAICVVQLMESSRKTLKHHSQVMGW